MCTTINKSTTVSVEINVKEVIASMVEEKYVFDDDEKRALVKLLFGDEITDRTRMMGNAVDYINSMY